MSRRRTARENGLKCNGWKDMRRRRDEHLHFSGALQEEGHDTGLSSRVISAVLVSPLTLWSAGPPSSTAQLSTEALPESPRTLQKDLPVVLASWAGCKETWEDFQHLNDLPHVSSTKWRDLHDINPIGVKGGLTPSGSCV